MPVRFPVAAFCLILGLAPALAQDLPQTPVAAAAFIFSYNDFVSYPRSSIHVIDENTARMGRPGDEVTVTRESDCVYRMRSWQLDFSKLTGYQQMPGGHPPLYLYGEMGLWCYDYTRPGTCVNQMPVYQASFPDAVSHFLLAVQFIQGFCPSQAPF